MKLQVIHSVWLFPLGLAAHRMGQVDLQSWHLSALGPSVGQQMPQITIGSTSACLWLLIWCQSRLSHRPDCFWEDFWWNQVDRTPTSPMGGAFQTSEKIVVVFPYPQPLAWVYLGLCPLTWLGETPSRPVGEAFRSQILGLLETRWMFLWLALRGKAQSDIWESV